MKASTVFLIAMLTVILVLIIYAVARDPSWARKDFWMANLVDSPWKVYGRSGGTFDDAAQLALRRATARPNPTPADHLLAATIITRNVLGQEHRPETDRAGRPTAAARERAQIRRDMFGQARGHYMAALTGLGAAGRVGGLPGGDPGAPRRVIDAALGFAFGGFNDLIANDPLLAAAGIEEWLPVGFTILQREPGGFTVVDEPLATMAVRRHEDVLRDNQRAAREVAQERAGARGAAVDTYVELAKQHTDDPQNVHDPSVLACLKAALARLRAEQGPLDGLPPVDAVRKDIEANGMLYSEGRPHVLEDALAVVARTTAGEKVMGLEATDAECLRRVWARADDPRNAATRGRLRQALFDALADSWGPDLLQGRKIECVTGRVDRILGALVLNDWDKRNWEVKKLEQFKNDIFERAGQVIEAVARRAAESGDGEQQKAGRLYLARSSAEARAVGEVSDEASAALAAQMKDEIGAMVDTYIETLERDLGIKGAIPEYMVNGIKEEAKAAVMA